MLPGRPLPLRRSTFWRAANHWKIAPSDAAPARPAMMPPHVPQGVRAALVELECVEGVKQRENRARITVLRKVARKGWSPAAWMGVHPLPGESICVSVSSSRISRSAVTPASPKWRTSLRSFFGSRSPVSTSCRTSDRALSAWIPDIVFLLRTPTYPTSASAQSGHSRCAQPGSIRTTSFRKPIDGDMGVSPWCSIPQGAALVVPS